MRPSPHSRGFTLLEVMIALAILAVSLVAIAGINSTAVDMHVYAKRLTVATMLARSKMADLESKLMSEDLPADDSAEEGKFEEEGFPDYQWRAEIIRPKTEKVTAADLLSMAGLDTATDPKKGTASNPVSLAQSIGGGNQQFAAAAATGGAGALGGMATQQVQTMLDLLGKSVREVRLTVSWPAGNRVDDFTVVTHVVSLGRGTSEANSEKSTTPATQSKVRDQLQRNSTLPVNFPR